MSLSYQPFAEVPEIQKLGNDLKMNVSDRERAISAAAGVSLLVVSLSGGKIGRLLLLAAGALLIGRGWAGRCQWYHQLGVDSRHASPSHP